MVQKSFEPHQRWEDLFRPEKKWPPYIYHRGEVVCLACGSPDNSDGDHVGAEDFVDNLREVRVLSDRRVVCATREDNTGCDNVNTWMTCANTLLLLIQISRNAL